MLNKLKTPKRPRTQDWADHKHKTNIGTHEFNIPDTSNATYGKIAKLQEFSLII
jgi:hypothetical protein